MPRDNYKSIQLNLNKKKHKYLIDWIDNMCEEEERSINSLVVNILKKEFNRCQEKEK